MSVARIVCASRDPFPKWFERAFGSLRGLRSTANNALYSVAPHDFSAIQGLDAFHQSGNRQFTPTGGLGRDNERSFQVEKCTSTGSKGVQCRKQHSLDLRCCLCKPGSVNRRLGAAADALKGALATSKRPRIVRWFGVALFPGQGKICSLSYIVFSQVFA